jgi:hypothetical protein
VEEFRAPSINTIFKVTKELEAARGHRACESISNLSFIQEVVEDETSAIGIAPDQEWEVSDLDINVL